MHISRIAVTNLSIKTPLIVVFGGQKKRSRGNYSSRPSCYRSINYYEKAVTAKKLYHKFDKQIIRLPYLIRDNKEERITS